VLGLTVTEESGYATVYDANGTMLRVTVVAEVRPAPYTVLGWAVADVEAALGALAVEPVQYDGLDQDEHGVWIAPSGTRVAWFRDPDSNVLSLSERS
jgi:hypothetical protein